MIEFHLIYVAACNGVGDELWSGDVENNAIKTTNTIGIIFNGTANSFYKNEQGAWSPYISGGNLMGLVRRNFSDFGWPKKIFWCPIDFFFFFLYIYIYYGCVQKFF